MEVLSEIVKMIFEIVVGYTIGAVARQMGYLIRFKRNVENLSNKVDDLEDARKSVEHKVEAARMNVEEIDAKVLRWLERVETITEDAHKFLKEEGQAKLKCFNLKARYQIGRRAHKMGLAVKELKDTADTFDTVGHRVPMRGGTTISTKGYEDFESRKSTLNGIMRALKDDSIRAIGVYGMGGVGKTTLVEKIATQAKEDKLFERIVKVVVSQTPDLEKIQKDIAKELGLSFQDHETDSQKADLLRKQLKREKILLIIDDIWNEIDFESRGISFEDDKKGSKLLLTSRSEEVLGKYTDPQEIFSVGALSTNEAKYLFSKTVGDLDENLNFESIMVELVEECAGLPIAITTVANALKSQKNPNVWKDAVRQLKRANQTQIPEMHEKVYSSIKLSYDFLTEEAQSLFLFCSIFEQDKVIEIDLLLRYLVGLDFFEDVYKLEDVRNRVHTLVNSLKDSCLLLEGKGTGTFKMHDVIRDVAIYIANKEEKMLAIRSLEGPEKWLNIKKWEASFGIALFDVDFKELPERLGCPQLKFILMGNKRLICPPIPNNFFEGMKELRVLVLTKARLPHPSSISCLRNLQSLVLHQCELEDVALIGELKNLRALTLSRSHIEQLPMEIRQLTHLQLLDLNYCTELDVIPSNVFSDLRELAELYMKFSFDQWHVDGEITKRNNTRVSELNNLPSLTTLYIDIPNPKVLPNAFLFGNLERYEILIGNDQDWDWYCDDEFEISRKLKLQLDRGLQIEDGIKVLLKSCEYLDLTPWEGIENILYEVDKEGFPQLKYLYVRNSTEIQYIVNLMEFQCVAFPVLQSLSLYNIENLEEICHDQVPKGSFLSLKKLKVSKCEKLTSAFSLTMFGCFSQLQEIEIEDCKLMCAIFSKERKHLIQVNHDIAQLRSLNLKNLPNLVGFHPDVDSQLLFNEKVAFSNLEEIYIEGIDNLKMLWHNHQLILDSFCKIKKLHVGNCKNLMNIFPPNMLRRLQSLEELTIKDCNSVEEVFEVRGQNVDEICDKGSTQLRHLTLNNLPKLKHVWTSDPEAILTFQNLREVEVSQCKTLKSLFPISVAKHLEQLESLHINNCGLMEEIVALEEGLESMTKFVFPQITSLSLELLLELKCFYPGKHTSEWPSLKNLTIRKCDKVKIVALNELSFSNRDGLGHHIPVQQPLFYIEKDTLSNLEELKLDWDDTISQTYDRLKAQFSCKLKVLGLYSKDRWTTFPWVFVQGLYNLKELDISNFFLEEICPCGIVDNEGQYAEMFERLTTLHLSKMPKLMHLWKENSQQGMGIQNLESLHVSECGRLKNLVPSSMYFRNLNTLEVLKCHGLISLATSSAVKSLVQLKRLTIHKCKRMREIVTSEGEGEAGDEICFNQLNYLSLYDLPTLGSFFHLGNRTMKLPSLQSLYVTKCPELKIFSNGVLSMPKLYDVGMDGNYWSAYQTGQFPVEDVNTFIKRCWEKNNDPCLRQLFTQKTGASEVAESEHDDQKFAEKLRKASQSLPESSSTAAEGSFPTTQVSLPESTSAAAECSLAKRQDSPESSSPMTKTPKISDETDVLTNHQSNQDGAQDVFSFQRMKVSEISQLRELPKNLHSLKIEGCDVLENIPEGVIASIPILQRLYIINCCSLKSFPEPIALKILHIQNCKNLEFPPLARKTNQYALLEHLCIGNSCDSLTSLPLNLFPKLRCLSIWDCKNLESFSMLEGNQKDLTSLEALEIRDCPNLVYFPKGGLPTPNLTSIWLSKCKNLKKLPHQLDTLNSLLSIFINNCPELVSLPYGGLPSNLSLLCITSCDKLTLVRDWGLLRLDCLIKLEIEGGCENVKSFPEEKLLPSNLNSLRVSRLLNLQYLDYKGLQHLTALKTLEISCCDKLESLPEEGLPSSLSVLCIKECSLLKPKLQKQTGDYWRKIAHISFIETDEEVISRSNENAILAR